MDPPNYSVPGKNEPRETSRKWLLELCITFLHKYLLEGETVLPVIKRIEELHRARKEGFSCRFEGCVSKYILHSARVR